MYFTSYDSVTLMIPLPLLRCFSVARAKKQRLIVPKSGSVVARKPKTKVVKTKRQVMVYDDEYGCIDRVVDRQYGYIEKTYYAD